MVVNDLCLLLVSVVRRSIVRRIDARATISAREEDILTFRSRPSFRIE